MVVLGYFDIFTTEIDASGWLFFKELQWLPLVLRNTVTIYSNALGNVLEELTIA